MKHYAFVDGQVIGPVLWEAVSGLPVGTFTCTPHDKDTTWCRLTSITGNWKVLPLQEVSPEFRMQLLLLGVPT